MSLKQEFELLRRVPFFAEIEPSKLKLLAFMSERVGFDPGKNLMRQGDQADAAYLSSCDVPFLRPAFVHRLIDLLGEHAICVPHVGDYHHPLAAVYRMEVEEAVRRLLAVNRLRPFFLFESVPTRVVEATELADVDPAFESLRNLNTPEDYEAALREAGGAP